MFLFRFSEKFREYKATFTKQTEEDEKKFYTFFFFFLSTAYK